MAAARNWSIVVLCLAAASCSKCSKKPPADADAAAEGGADASVDGALDAGAAEAAAATVEDAAVAPRTPAFGAVSGTGGPFAGTYKCLGGLTLTQNGNLVSGVTVTKTSTSTETTQWNCSVVKPDHCEGAEVVTVRFNDPKKTPKAPENRKLSIEHRADGVAIHLERSTETTFCKK